MFYQWDELTDELNKNVFHYACELNDISVVKMLVKFLTQNVGDQNILQKLILGRDSEGFIPRQYADPHRPIAKHLTKLEQLEIKNIVKKRREIKVGPFQHEQEQSVLMNKEKNDDIKHSKLHIREWNDEEIKLHLPKSRESRALFDGIKVKKKRGVSTNVTRLRKSQFFEALYQHFDRGVPEAAPFVKTRFDDFRTPKRSRDDAMKRMSSFNENRRRPINTLTIPKKGDVVSDFNSISSVRSENSNVNIDAYSNNLRSFNLGSPNNNKKTQEHAHKLNSKQIGKHDPNHPINDIIGCLVCKESNNYSEIGDSIINKRHQSSSIYPNHIYNKKNID